MRAFRGFNLIELMIAVTIIGILSAICLPIYSQHLVHEKRLEAEINLMKVTVALERYFIVHDSYQDATLRELNLSEDIAGNQYKLVIAKASAGDFLVQAVPLDKQAEKDSECGVLSVDAFGKKSVSGNGGWENCWR